MLLLLLVVVVVHTQAVAAHPRGLGSGWRMVLQALRLGTADGAPAVMAQSQEALQVRTEGRVPAAGAGDRQYQVEQAARSRGWRLGIPCEMAARLHVG
jgi:hypothetical protein